jgi:hypothetical protein
VDLLDPLHHRRQLRDDAASVLCLGG